MSSRFCKERLLHATPPGTPRSRSSPSFRFLIAVAVLAACGAPPGTGNPPPQASRDATLPGTAAVRVEPWTDGGWIALVETLQTQLLVTMPKRKLVWLDADLAVSREYLPPDGRFLIDFAAHPSGAATALEIRAGARERSLPPANPRLADPLPARWNRRLGRARLGDSHTGERPRILFSLDRGRLAAAGEDVQVAMRWSDNSVRAHRLEFRDGTFRPVWTTVVEPPADLLSIGIIGGGFDNFTRVIRRPSSTSTSTRPGRVRRRSEHRGRAPGPRCLLRRASARWSGPRSLRLWVAMVTRVAPDGARSYASSRDGDGAQATRHARQCADALADGQDSHGRRTRELGRCHAVLRRPQVR